MRKSAAAAAALFATVSIVPSSGLASTTSPMGLRPSSSGPDVREFRDPDEPGIGSTDIRRVVVDNNKRRVHVWVKEAGRLHQETRLWIDSVKADPGPEYLVGGYQNSEFSGWRVEGFGDPKKRRTWHCGGFRMKDDGQDRWVHYLMDSECLRGPGHIRVHVDSKGDKARDFAPDKSASGNKRFYAWVNRAGRLQQDRAGQRDVGSLTAVNVEDACERLY